MAMWDRKKLLKREEFKVEKVDIGDGNFVYIRQMSAFEKNQLQLSLTREEIDADGNVIYKQNLENFHGKLLVNTICDEKGKLLLSPEDSITLTKAKSGVFIEKLAAAAQRLNGITEEQREQLVKN